MIQQSGHFDYDENLDAFYLNLLHCFSFITLFIYLFACRKFHIFESS